MHAVADRGGGGGGGSWRLPPDETLQVQDPKDKQEEVSIYIVVALTVFKLNLYGILPELIYSYFAGSGIR